jgi:hypothetical protein
MTEDPEEIMSQAKQATSQIADVIEAIAPSGVARATLAAPIAITAKAGRLLDKMATKGVPLARMAAMGIIRSGPKINAPGRER